jgi:hypothetical protein
MIIENNKESIYLCENLDNNKVYCVKSISKKYIFSSEEIQEDTEY